MKFFKRIKQDGTIFFIDELGSVVDEKTAKRNLSESRGHRVELTESQSLQKNLVTIAAEFRRRGLTEAAAHARAVELVESQRRTRQQNAERDRRLIHAKLEEAFMRGGLSADEAKIAAEGR